MAYTQLWNYGDTNRDASTLHLSGPNGSWYVLAADFTSQTLKMYKGNLDGSSWAFQDTSNEPAIDTEGNSSIRVCLGVIDPSTKIIHILYSTAFTQYEWDIKHVTFNTDLASSNQDTWGTPEYVKQDADGPYIYENGICLDSNGKIHVLLNMFEGKKTIYQAVYYTNNISGWKTPVYIDGGESSSTSCYGGGITIDSNDIPHLTYKESYSPYNYKWGYGNQNDATSFSSWGTIFQLSLGIGTRELSMNSNDKMVVTFLSSFWYDVRCWTETTFPSYTLHTDDWSEDAYQGCEMTCGLTTYGLYDNYGAPTYGGVCLQKHLSSGWIDGELLHADPVGGTWTQIMDWENRASLPPAIGYLFSRNDAPRFDRIIFELVVTPAAAEAGTYAVWPLPPEEVTPASANAGCESSVTVIMTGPQWVTPDPAIAGTFANAVVFQSSCTQTPDIAEAGTYSFVIYGADNTIIFPEVAEAQCWADVPGVNVAGHQYCIPSVARARTLRINPEYIVDYRPFNQGILGLQPLALPNPATWATGEAGFADLHLRPLEAFCFIVTETLAYGAFVLPTLTAIGSGIPGSVGSGSIELPALKLSANNTERVGQAHFYFTFPQISGSLLTGIGAEMDVELPKLSALGYDSGRILVAAGNLDLKGLRIEGMIYLGQLMSGSLNFPHLQLFGADEGALQMIGDIELPNLLAEGIIGQNEAGQGWLVFPALEAMGIIELDHESNFISGLLSLAVSAMHARTASVTDYENFHFNSFATMHGKYIGANENGIYAFDSANDDGSLIEAEIIKLDVDLEDFRSKCVTDAYIHHHTSGPYKVFTYADGIVAVQSVDRASDAIHANKVNLARGLWGSELGFGYANEQGSDFILEEIDYVVSTVGVTER